MTRLSACPEREVLWRGRQRTLTDPLEVHVPAAAMAVATGGTGPLLLGHVGHERLRREHHAADRSGVLKGGAGHLDGVHDALFEHVAVLALEGVEAMPDGQQLHGGDDDRALGTGVLGDLPDRGLHPPALDDGHAPGELGQALLELLLVVVRGGLLDLRLDLRHARLDGVRAAGALHDGRVVLRGDEAASLTEVLGQDAVELAADLLADDIRAGEDGDVAQHLLAPIAKARGLDGQDREGTAELVHDQGGERLTVDVLGDDEDRATELDRFLQRRQELLDARDLLVRDEHGRVLEHGFHAVGVGHEVGRDVAAVELHALRVFLVEADRLAFLDGDDAVLADLAHDLGDQLTDLGVGGADGGHGGDVLAVLDRSGVLLEPGHDGLDALLETALDDHRVGAGGNVLEALGDDGLAEHDRGGGAVAGDVVGLGRDLLEELRAHVLEGLVELDLAGDGHAVVGDGGGAELLVQDHVAALGPERDLDGVGEAVDAALEGATSGLVEDELLSHDLGILLGNGAAGPWAGPG